MIIDEVTRSSFELYCSIYADKYMKRRGLHKKFNLLEIENIKTDMLDDISVTVNCLIESSIESIVSKKMREREEE